MGELQYQIDFDARLPIDAQEGMQSADEHADDRWKRDTDACIRAVALRRQEFTVDEVREEWEKVPHRPTTHTMAALGPRMKEVAETMGYMTATDALVRSKRKGSNGNLHRVWRSNIYRGEQCR